MEVDVYGWGALPCLHCGEIVNVGGDLHVCNAPKKEWLDKQKVALIQMPDGNLWDLKNQCVKELQNERGQDGNF